MYNLNSIDLLTTDNLSVIDYQSLNGNDLFVSCTIPDKIIDYIFKPRIYRVTGLLLILFTDQ